MTPYLSVYSPSRRAALAVRLFAAGLLLGCAARGAPGATEPWTTYEAEAMRGDGVVLGPTYEPHRVETEASGQRCVSLSSPGAFVEFRAAAAADALVLRYSLPDSPEGGGLSAALELLVDGRVVRTLALSSRYAHLYGDYPFSNRPGDGKPRNFYDELRVKDLSVAEGSVVRLRKTAGGASVCIVDLVDLEKVPAPLEAPANALSVLEFGADRTGRVDATHALRACLAAALGAGKTVWVPPGEYKLSGDILLPSSASIQGAGFWHTTFVGDENLYGRPDRRVRFKLKGSGIRLSDFAIVGRLDYRNDDEPNDGVVGAGCADSAVSRLWIEHTKVGVWIYNGSRLRIEGCRFRNLLADGVNLCVGTAGSTVEDCSARGTGDDCFAIWPAPSDQGFEQRERPGGNVIRRCTGRLPFLANGGALYGGAGNRIEDCLFSDISAGCGILVSTTFPTSDPGRKVDNNFSGTTVVSGCELVRCGGYDHNWGWRGAFQICMDRRSISGLAIDRVSIRDSLSDGLTVVGPGSSKGEGTLSDSRLENVVVSGVGLGVPSSRGLWIREDARGSLLLVASTTPIVRNDSPAFELRETGK